MRRCASSREAHDGDDKVTTVPRYVPPGTLFIFSFQSHHVVACAARWGCREALPEMAAMSGGGRELAVVAAGAAIGACGRHQIQVKWKVANRIPNRSPVRSHRRHVRRRPAAATAAVSHAPPRHAGVSRFQLKFHLCVDPQVMWQRRAAGTVPAAVLGLGAAPGRPALVVSRFQLKCLLLCGSPGDVAAARSVWIPRWCGRGARAACARGAGDQRGRLLRARGNGPRLLRPSHPDALDGGRGGTDAKC